jgi:hypothetical protein
MGSVFSSCRVSGSKADIKDFLDYTYNNSFQCYLSKYSQHEDKEYLSWGGFTSHRLEILLEKTMRDISFLRKSNTQFFCPNILVPMPNEYFVLPVKKDFFYSLMNTNESFRSFCNNRGISVSREEWLFNNWGVWSPPLYCGSIMHSKASDSVRIEWSSIEGHPYRFWNKIIEKFSELNFEVIYNESQ